MMQHKLNFTRSRYWATILTIGPILVAIGFLLGRDISLISVLLFLVIGISIVIDNVYKYLIQGAKWVWLMSIMDFISGIFMGLFHRLYPEHGIAVGMLGVLVIIVSTVLASSNGTKYEKKLLEEYMFED